MKKKKKEVVIDRRIQKTKKLLSNALVELIIEKGYNDVSIKDIIDRANVGRSTFYSHFESKEQLLLTGHDTFKKLLNENFVMSNDPSRNAIIDFLFLYQHVKEKYQLTKTMMSKEGTSIISDHLYNILTYRIEKYFSNKVHEDKTMFTLTISAAASAMLKLLMTWVENGMPYSPEEMAEKSQALLMKMMS